MVRDNSKDMPDWEAVLASMCRPQQCLPDAVLVGGSAAALHVGHRLSVDHDHTIGNLKERYDDILRDLESVAGWKTARKNRPVLILGSLDGIETGIRPLRRMAPLETTEMKAGAGIVRVPTLEEALRIKVWLSLTRNATRDYLDTAALSDALGPQKTVTALMPMDKFYRQDDDVPWAVRTQIIKQFSEAKPYDLDEVDLSEYKGVKPPYDSWAEIEKRCKAMAATLSEAFETAIENDAGGIHDEAPEP